MAFTEFATGSPQAVKRWSESLLRETFGKMGITTLIGRDERACIQLKMELDKDPGDEIRYDLLTQDRSNGVNGDARLKGFEKALTFFQDVVKINQKRHAHAFKHMSQQRTVHDLRRAGRNSLSEWWAWFIEGGIFAHMAGYAGDGLESVAGALGVPVTEGTDWAGNTITPLDADHLVGNDAAVFDIDHVVDAVARAKTLNPRVAPIKINGQETYCIYLHPYQVRDLRKSTGSQWTQIVQNARERGNSNPLFTDALGMWQNVVLKESEFVPTLGSGGTQKARAIMLGQGAGCIAMGNAWRRQSRANAGGGTFFKYSEEIDDFGNEEAVAAGSILGFKRSMFGTGANGAQRALGIIGIDSLAVQ